MNGSSTAVDPSGIAPERPTRRGLLAGGVFLLFAALFVGLPLLALHELGARGVTAGATALQVIAGGVALALLFAVTYFLRPTRAYGPALAARAVVGILYLVLLAPFVTARATVDGNVDAFLRGTDLMLWLVAVPAIGLVAALFVILSDTRDPGLRLRREFPA